ncbi:MAG: PQQ-binding-like beta-propeller repeat protein, partial [Planctomycetaceae bacterium]|nr:PQQ-binding-like beta-propeller repeat protein [Planctomycetaceae bacterium]
LQPISEEISTWEKQSQPSAPRKTAKPDSSSEKKEPKSVPQETEFEDMDNQAFFEQALEEEPEEQEEVVKTTLSRSGRTDSSSGSQAVKPTSSGLRESLYASRQRPGEKEIFRSPLIMGLTLLGVFLLIGSVILWSLIDLEEADRYLAQAREQAEQRKFQQAIENYEQFLIKFPSDSEQKNASRELSLTRVRSQLDIGVPDLAAGLRELEELIDRHRNEKTFNELHEQISRYARQIALDACQQAAEDRDRELFNLSERALKLVNLYTADEERLAQIQTEVREARKTAESTILRLDKFDEFLADMKSALEAKEPAQVMELRRHLISQYASAETDPRVIKLLEEALQVEQSAATIQEEIQQPLPVDAVKLSPVLTLSQANQIVKDELPSNRAVIVHAADCLYGVDSDVGIPIWRHPVGTQLPFFPLEITTGNPGILSYDSETHELHFLNRDTGDLNWRQSCGDEISGSPLVLRNDAYLTTQQGRLLKLDLSSGQVLANIQLTQPIATGPSLSPDKSHLICVGNRDVLYVVSLNPFEISEVIYLGHRPGTIQTAPVEMNPYLLIAENHDSNTCRLRLFDSRPEGAHLTEIHLEELPGNALDPLELRGNLLFVPTTPERVTAYTISAEKNAPEMAKTSSYQAVNPRFTPAWLSAGPDGLLWTASAALRQLQLRSEALEPSTDEVAAGLATQPLQMLGESLYAARHPFYSSTVFISRYDRNTFDGYWSLKLGDRFHALHLNSNGELITLQDSGEVFRIRPNEFNDRGFKLKQNFTIPIPRTLTTEVFMNQFSDGRFGVAWGGEEPTLVTVRTTGLVEKNNALPDKPVTPPVDLEAGTAIGLPGRVHLVHRNGTQVEDYLLPVEEGKQVAWEAFTRLDGTHLLTLDAEQTLRKIEYQPQPIPHFSLNQEITLDHPSVTHPMRTRSGHIVFADSNKQLHVLDPDSLQIISSQKLPDFPVHDPWITNDHFFLELKDHTLLCLQDDENATLKWKVSLANASCTGTPLIDGDSWLVPTSETGFIQLEVETGRVIDTVPVPGHCDGDPVRLDDSIAFPLTDGSLYFHVASETEEK